MILVMGGTADSRELVRRLSAQGRQVIVTTATEYGAQLLKNHGQQLAQAERLDDYGLTTFIQQHGIDILIDATHPYADVASQTAMRVCHNAGCRYLRYERQTTYLEDFCGTLISVPDYTRAAQWIIEHSEGNVLLTTGSKTLPIFVNIVGTERLIARVLPSVTVLQSCIDLGLKPGQIIAMQGPFGEAINIAFLNMFNVRVLVTKDSGETGGMPQKLSASEKTDTIVLLIERPKINYLNQYDSLEDLLNII